MRQFLLLLLLLLAQFAQAQNLVPNPSFEEYNLNILDAPQPTEPASLFIEDLVMLGNILLAVKECLALKVFQSQSTKMLSTRNILPIEHVQYLVQPSSYVTVNNRRLLNHYKFKTTKNKPYEKASLHYRYSNFYCK